MSRDEWLSAPTVWFLSEGSYSDYCVHGVFRTEEAALTVKRLLEGREKNWREYRVEESVLLDGYVNDVAVLTLQAIVSTDGSVWLAEPRTMDDLEVGIPYRSEGPCRVIVRPGTLRPGGLAATELIVRGTDHERCQKVFSERRAQILSDPFISAVRAWSSRGHTRESLTRCGINPLTNELFIDLVTR